MENKYYTPAIEDIRVGYECEIYEAGSNTKYKTIIVSPDSYFTFFQTVYNNNLQEGWVRTPYLTKEQIEKEGWEPYKLEGWAYQHRPSYRHGFTKGNYMCVLDDRKPHIEIIAKDVLLVDWMPEFPEQFRISIPCPSINEFRQITKLICQNQEPELTENKNQHH